MMGRFDLEAHLFQHVHHRTPGVFAEVGRRQIEVAADIVRRRRDPTLRRRPEQEELRFHPGVHRVAELGGASDRPFQHASRVASEWLTFRRVDVADHACDARVRLPPRKDPERREIGREEHVGLLDTHEALDGRSVEHDVPCEGLLELRRRNLDVLVHAKDIGELQPHRSHAELSRDLENLFRGRPVDVGSDRSGGHRQCESESGARKYFVSPDPASTIPPCSSEARLAHPLPA